MSLNSTENRKYKLSLADNFFKDVIDKEFEIEKGGVDLYELI